MWKLFWLWLPFSYLRIIRGALAHKSKRLLATHKRLRQRTSNPSWVQNTWKEIQLATTTPVTNWLWCLRIRDKPRNYFVSWTELVWNKNLINNYKNVKSQTAAAKHCFTFSVESFCKVSLAQCTNIKCSLFCIILHTYICMYIYLSVITYSHQAIRARCCAHSLRLRRRQLLQPAPIRICATVRRRTLRTLH